MHKRCCGKKILILGGAYQHCKTVEAAKNLGITTVVVDYLVDSPAKKIADKSFLMDVMDVAAIVDLCRKEKIDGVINTSLDPCQIPYQKICEKLAVPCFGTKEQFYILTNKLAFKECCAKYGIDTIPSYSEESFNQLDDSSIEYPILVKPVDSRGSRGQTICYSRQQVSEAIAYAKKETKTGTVVIEKFMSGCDDFTMSYLFVNGECRLIRTGDRYLGSRESGLDTVAIAADCPSKHTEMFLDKINQPFIRMLKEIGIRNGPIFMQGFVDGDTIRFYDPGLRFAGGDYERLFQLATGINLMEMLVFFSVTGTFPEIELPDHLEMLNGKRIIQLCPILKPGRIKEVIGEELVTNHKNVIIYSSRYKAGDRIYETRDISRRFAEIELLCNNITEEKEAIEFIQTKLKVLDENGQNLLCDPLDIAKL